ncbi:copper chaperone PCu(A)C [Croceicoccus sp. Ery5]|uniref:copper chaperone PCu(A)C n=1 Tax=Croceicoccus sp. Ery5 TaxID=1703340 RepID=UPI001E56882D|nr:copper chaperone PCu(A)C [Croceicoccus sp. Ery5]
MAQVCKAAYLAAITNCVQGTGFIMRSCTTLLWLAAAALPLAACGDSTPSDDTAQQDAAAPSQLGMVLDNAAIRLPAVSGRPAGAYFTLQSLRDEPVRIAGVDVTGAGEAELHETKVVDGVSMMAAAGTIVLEPRETVQFAPGGFHVMLFDIDPALVAGGTTDLTLTLENGDKISATAQIVGPADPLSAALEGAKEAMPAMDHSAHEGMAR